MKHLKKISMYSFICFLSISFSTLSMYAEDAKEAQEKPRCNSNQECLKPGMVGSCQNPGQKNATCVYQEIMKVETTVILPKDCQTCTMNSHAVLNGFKVFFPGLSVEQLDSDSERAKKFIQDLKIEMLPAYILSKQVEKDPNFVRIQKTVDLVGDYYYIKPSFVGVSYFVGRHVNPGQLDLFLILVQQDTSAVLKATRELSNQKKDKVKFNLHFVGKQDEETGEFLNPAGTREVNEDKLYACVEKYYPDKSWDYLSCRVNDIDNLWWEDCLEKNNIDSKKMKECTKSEEANGLLKEKNKLSRELNIFYSPIFLLDNVEVITANDRTTAAEILKIIDSRAQTMSKGGK